MSLPKSSARVNVEIVFMAAISFFFFVICLFFSTTGYNTYNNLLTLHVTIHYLYLQLNYMTYLQFTTGSI